MNFARLSALMAPLALGAVAACYTATEPSPAAGTTSNSNDADDAGAVVGTPEPSPFALGQVIVQTYACTSCHGSDLSGNIEQDAGVYSANITPDMDTGIGSWTLPNLTSALREGLDDQGDPICAAMPRFPSLADNDIVDLYAYLQGIPAVSKAQTDTDCQGNPQSGDDDDDSGADGGGITDAGADAAPDSGPDASDLCPHKVCVVGAGLAPSCGDCAATVCSHEPSCCQKSWTAECVDVVDLYCVTQCN